MKLTLQNHPIAKILRVEGEIDSHEVEVLRAGVNNRAEKSTDPLIIDLIQARVKKKDVLKRLLEMKTKFFDGQKSVFFLCAHPSLGDASSLDALIVEIKNLQNIKSKWEALKLQKARLEMKLTALHDKSEIAKSLQEKNEAIQTQIDETEENLKEFLGYESYGEPTPKSPSPLKSSEQQ